jgi:hypothetical protein
VKHFPPANFGFVTHSSLNLREKCYVLLKLGRSEYPSAARATREQFVNLDEVNNSLPVAARSLQYQA